MAASGGRWRNGKAQARGRFVLYTLFLCYWNADPIRYPMAIDGEHVSALGGVLVPTANSEGTSVLLAYGASYKNLE